MEGVNKMIIGHKGTSAYAPENTIASVKRAIEMGLKFIEIDVQLTKDKKVVVIHDYLLDRTTEGSGWVKEHTFEEIKQFSAGSWFSDEYVSEKVPALEEILEILPKDVMLNIEVKNIARERSDIEERILGIIGDYGVKEQILISSFDHISLLKLRKLDENIKLGMLIYSYWVNPWEMIEKSEIKPYSINPAIEYLDEAFVIEGHKRGYKIFPYTVNTKKEYEYCMQINADGVFSDYPDLREKE